MRSRSFSYTDAQWAEIVRDIPALNSSENRRAMESECYGYIHSDNKGRKKYDAANAEDIQKLGESVVNVRNEFIRLAEVMRVPSRTISALADGLEQVAKNCKKISRGMVRDNSGGPHDAERTRLLEGLLNIWVRHGGTLKMWVSPTGQPGGAVLRFLLAAANPALKGKRKLLSGESARGFVRRMDKSKPVRTRK